MFLPGESQGWRSLVGCSPCGHEESDRTEWLHFHFSHSCTGEGNGNPLQCSCLENPRDGEAWWAAVYGVTQSRTRLKWLSSSSSSSSDYIRRRHWRPTPVLLPGKSHGRRSLVGCCPWGRWESDTTEQLHFTFHFHALEKEMAAHSSVLAWRIPGTGASWAAVYEVAQSRTQLKRLSSSSAYIISSWRLAGGYSFCLLLMSMSEAFFISFIL